MLDTNTKDFLRKLTTETEINQKLVDAMEVTGLNDERALVVDDLITKGDFGDLASKSQALRAKIAAYFRALQEEGLGKFLIGRRGHPSRFILGTDLTLDMLLEASRGETGALDTMAVAVAS